MNATMNSAVKARNPQYVSSRVPRVIAALAAIVVTLVLFDGVALLGGLDPEQGSDRVDATVVAQNASTVEAR